MMDDDFGDDINSSKFVTDTSDSTDQDSLDEKIDSEQRLKNHQLWASFQTTASCITKLYKDRAHSNPWVPFQNAASNLATLYKDCIESQRKFAKIGYQHGRRRKMRELTKLFIKQHHKLPTKVSPRSTNSTAADYSDHNIFTSSATNSQLITSEVPTNSSIGQQHNTTTTTNVSSILNVNQLNLGNDESRSLNFQTPTNNQLIHHHHQQQQPTNINNQQQANLQILLGNNNEDDLFTFQQALSEPAISSGKIKSNQQQQQHSRRPCSNSSGYLNSSRTMVNESKTEEERLLELNQFLSEEYHRHVGSRKRSCSNLGGDAIKRHRE